MTSLGEVAWRKHHDVSLGPLYEDQWESIGETAQAWWEAVAQAVVSRFLATAIGGAVTFDADDAAELIEYGRLRELVLSDLQCPTSPTFGTDLAVRIRALIDVADELLGASSEGGKS